MPLDEWSPFFLASRESLSNTAGLLTISNHTLGLAVAQRYLGSPTARLVYHQELVAFFTKASPAICNAERRCEELPFQMKMADDWEGLRRFCLDLDHFKILLRVGRFDLHSYWRMIWEGEMPPDLGFRYVQALEAHEATGARRALPRAREQKFVRKNEDEHT